jgi:hypothetical protein
VYGGQIVGGGVLVGPQDHADFARSAWEDEILTEQISGVTLLEVRVKFGPNDTGPDASSTSNTNGGDNTAGEAPQVAVLTRKITLQGGRTGRGRMFLPGISETKVQNGNVNAASLINLNAAFLAWMNLHDTAQFPVALLHAEPGPAPLIVTEMQVQARVATQRRRIRKVGGRRSVLG